MRTVYTFFVHFNACQFFESKCVPTAFAPLVCHICMGRRSIVCIAYMRIYVKYPFEMGKERKKQKENRVFKDENS